MIFVVKSGIKRDKFETRELRERLFKELNGDGKNQVVIMPSDCTYDVINDHGYKNAQVVIKESEKG